MNQSDIQHREHWGSLVFKGFVQLLSIPMVLGGIIVIYELCVDPSDSIWVKIQERIAEGEKVSIETSGATEAWKEQLFQVAVAEIERVNVAYQALWQANSQVMVIAYQMEDKVLQSQIELIKDSYGATKFNTNMADIGCAVGGLIGDPTLRSGCDYAQNQRVKMAREIQHITEQHRSNIPQSIIDSLPNPDDLKVDTQRLRDLMEGIDHG